LLWGALFCLWIFTTLLALVIKQGSNLSGNIDPHEIVIIALAGMFGLFTTSLFSVQVHMIRLGQTTVESAGFRDMEHREEITLAQMHPWYKFSAMKQTRRGWDTEWGRIGREGNIWSLESKRENWEATMSRNVWWWFLPIGRSLSDGSTYPVNPRFDSEGRWRRRAEWPPELR
jgi:palmitoyltransferase